MNYTFPIITNIINILIVYNLAKSYFFVYHRDERIKTLCGLLLIANTFALVVGMIRFFVFTYNGVPEVLLFGNFADRYTMFFAYQLLNRWYK